MTTLKRTNDRALTFSGNLLASAQSSFNNASDRWSGQTGIRHTLNVWKTDGGNWVAQRITESQWEGSKTEYEAAVFGDTEKLSQFFGFGRLAQELYDRANIEVVEKVA